MKKWSNTVKYCQKTVKYSVGAEGFKFCCFFLKKATKKAYSGFPPEQLLTINNNNNYYNNNNDKKLDNKTDFSTV